MWHGRKPFTAYRQQFPRFMSEFGFQALPPLKTIQTYAEPEDRNMTSYIMEHHQRSPRRQRPDDRPDDRDLPHAEGFPALVYLSMVLQAEGIRYGVEHWRRNRDRVSGTLIWQLNDCWPVASWSSIDYFGRWKALHYAARKFYAPVLLSVEDKAEVMDVFVTNDTVRAWTGEVRWSLQTTSGKHAQGRDREGHRQGAGSRLDLPSGFQPTGSTTSNRRQVVFVAELWKGHETHLAPTGSLRPQQAPGPGRSAASRCKVSLSGGLLKIELTARSLARFVEVELEGVDVVFSDNYFDLPAGQTVAVTCPLPQGWSLEQAREAVRVYSLVDSY